MKVLVPLSRLAGVGLLGVFFPVWFYLDVLNPLNLSGEASWILGIMVALLLCIVGLALSLTHSNAGALLSVAFILISSAFAWVLAPTKSHIWGDSDLTTIWALSGAALLVGIVAIVARFVLLQRDRGTSSTAA